MNDVYVDATDLVEFLSRSESPSGVQRVIAEVAPVISELTAGHVMVLDRVRGVFVELSADEIEVMLERGVRASTIDRSADLPSHARRALTRSRTSDPIAFDSSCTVIFLGALWISDALMSATRLIHSQGVRIITLFYDLTPILETGHTASVNRLFERYLSLLCDVASSVPAISVSSRRDFESYARTRRGIVPSGRGTGLPCGLTPDGRDLSRRPWPRPYVLFVGTIEARKNHILALKVWKDLISRLSAEVVPDLVCIGRLGWYASEFLEEYVASNGLNGKVSVLSHSVADNELATFYAHAEFTVYPSKYEGWGLPIGESLAFGKVPVVADNSSLREVGGNAAIYVPTNDAASFAREIERLIVDEDYRRRSEERVISEGPTYPSWRTVAESIVFDMDTAERRESVFPEVDLGREYMLSPSAAPPDEGHADKYLAYLSRDRKTPLLHQDRGADDYAVTDAAFVGTFGSPQTWGLELRPGGYADIRFTRPIDGPLTVLLSTRSMPGRAILEVSGPGGPLQQEVYLGAVLEVSVGSGVVGAPAQARISVINASDSVEGFVGFRSFVVVNSGDSEAKLAALRAASASLRQELDFIQGTRSWRLTAPLRRWKGRGV